MEFDPGAALATNSAMLEIAAPFPTRNVYQPGILIRHARPVLAPSIGTLPQPVGFASGLCLLMAAIGRASLFLPRFSPAGIAAVSLSSVTVGTDAEHRQTGVATSGPKQELFHGHDDKASAALRR